MKTSVGVKFIGSLQFNLIPASESKKTGRGKKAMPHISVNMDLLSSSSIVIESIRVLQRNVALIKKKIPQLPTII